MRLLLDFLIYIALKLKNCHGCWCFGRICNCKLTNFSNESKTTKDPTKTAQYINKSTIANHNDLQIACLISPTKDKTSCR